MNRSILFVAMACTLALSACAVTVGVAPLPVVPVIPVTFEANLTTSQQCEYRGIAVSQDDARALGANLLLQYEASTDTSVAFASTSRGRRGRRGPNDVAVSANADMMAKAVYCPQVVVDQIVSTNSAVASR
jgi:hypothetical protein